MVGPPLIDALLPWAQGERSIEALALFGSHARGEADASSDIDLHVVTGSPARFADSRWTSALRGHALHAYVVRPATGGVQKVTALFSSGEVDMVIVPLGKLRLARWAVSLGLHRKPGKLQSGLAPMAIVMRPAHRVVKGGPAWTKFYATVVAEVPDPRVSDEEAEALASAAYIDAVWVVRKAARGEFVAAQRWLHRTPVENNFRLLNEWRVRRGEKPAFDARRAEKRLPKEERDLIAVEAGLDEPSLAAAARRSIAASRFLLKSLTGKSPAWPDV